jgi:ribosomal protein S18 acetylase RimI-like enzyme
LEVREVADHERGWLRDALAARWGGEEVLGRGRAWRPADLPTLMAIDEAGARVGMATYEVAGELAELVTIDALEPGVGAGRALLDAVAVAAREAGARRLRVMTTNDNLTALRIYQRAGFRLTELRPGAVDVARERKPSIPAAGADGIPIRDEIDLVREL